MEEVEIVTLHNSTQNRRPRSLRKPWSMKIKLKYARQGVQNNVDLTHVIKKVHSPVNYQIFGNEPLGKVVKKKVI